MPVVYVDYPGPASLTQIYGTFNRAMLRLIPSLRTYAEPLTAAMVEFYTMSQVLRAPLLLWGLKNAVTSLGFSEGHLGGICLWLGSRSPESWD